MKLEETPNSLQEAKLLLGMSKEDRLGFERVEIDGVCKFMPLIQWQGMTYRVGDEIPDLRGTL